MFKDPIVDAVRKIREQQASKFNFDIRAIILDAQRRQRLSKHKLVSFQQRKDTVKQAV